MSVLARLKYFARNKYAWPGGYPQYAICADGGVLSHKAVIDNYRLVYRATQNKGTDKQWEVVDVNINYEDPDLYCDHTGERIESAYCEEQE